MERRRRPPDRETPSAASCEGTVLARVLGFAGRAGAVFAGCGNDETGSMKVFAPFGFYGAGNIGDEATLQGFARLLQNSGADIRATLVAQNARHTARVEPFFRYIQDRGHGDIRHRFADHTAQAYVFAGGTPIQDGLGGWPLQSVIPMVEHGVRWNKPVVFIGVGVEHLVHEELRERVSRVVVPGVAFWTVRSDHDQERLIELGVPANKVVVASDMAWLMPKAGPDYGRRSLRPHVETARPGRPLIGVNVNAESDVLARAPRMFEELAAGLDTLIDEHNARVVFLFNEVRDGPTYDVAGAERVRSLMRRSDATFSLSNDYLTPSEMMSIIDNCALTIGTRYHFCLFSAIQGVPFLGLKRSDKVADLCADLHWPYGATPEEAKAPMLADQARILLTTPKQALDAMKSRVEAMNTRAQVNARGLDALRVAVAQARRGETVYRSIGRFLNRSRGKPA